MSNRKLLLADDSMTIQKVVNLTFADEGIDVTSVSDGDAAIRYLESERPDIILADVHMPGANGYQICEYIRSHPETAAIPLILLAGSFEPFDEEEARRVGANSSLRKPFESIRGLVEQVSELLNTENSIPTADDGSTGQEVRPADHPEVQDIDSLYRESVEPETGPEITASPLGDPGMDDEMIETTYLAPAEESTELPAMEDQLGEQETEFSVQEEPGEPVTGYEPPLRETDEIPADVPATDGSQNDFGSSSEPALQNPEPTYVQDYFEPIEAPAIVEGIEETELEAPITELSDEVQTIDYAPAATDWEINAAQTDESQEPGSVTGWGSSEEPPVFEPHHEPFRGEEQQAAYAVSEESDLLDLPPVNEPPPPEAFDELFNEESRAAHLTDKEDGEPRAVHFSDEEINEIAESVAEKLGSAALRDIAKVLVPHVIEEISVRRPKGFG